MYSDKLVVAIKAGGKILRETKDLVQLPFGSEFSVLVKNLNSRRVKFTLHIDGTDVLDGEEIIVNANSEVEMKRFIRNGNMDAGNAFKFIERTAAIEEGPRGIKMDDGVVRVQFWFEKQVDTVITTTHHHRDVWWDNHYTSYYGSPRHIFGPSYTTTNTIGGSLLGNTTLSSIRSANVTANAATGLNNASYTSSAVSDAVAQAVNTVASFADESGGGAPADLKAEFVNDTGITVPGSKVEQKFHTVYGFVAETASNVIIIRLAGKVGEVTISTPVTVKSKQKCSTCGHVNKATAKFCGECGTALELV